MNDFRRFLAESTSPLDDFLAAEAIVHNCGTQLLDLISELGEAAIHSEMSKAFFATMQAGANTTGLVVLRFLAAWTALNSGRLEDCIAECDKVDDPFAAIFTVQGQALLELGRVHEALEVLQVAVRLSPAELLAWFQMVKARHVLGQLPEAFAALEKCRELAPNSEEVALYMALIAAEDDGQSPTMAKTGFHALRPHLAEHAHNLSVVFSLLKLAGILGDKSQALALIAASDWPQLTVQPEFLRHLPAVLRDWHTRGWMDVSGALLEQVA